MFGPADAHDAGVHGAGVKCVAQLMLMMLVSIAPVRNAWPSLCSSWWGLSRRCGMPGPADAHDVGVFRAGVECLAQLTLLMLVFESRWCGMPGPGDGHNAGSIAPV